MRFPETWPTLAAGQTVSFFVGGIVKGLYEAMDVVRDLDYAEGGVGTVSAGQFLEGVVSQRPVSQRFGFISTVAGRNIFFHKTALQNPSDWELLTVGTRVTFSVEQAADGRLFASSITPEGGSVDLPKGRLRGSIFRKSAKRSWAYIRTADGGEYFFHRTGLLPSEDWESLIDHDTVEFLLTRSEDGRVVASDVQRVPFQSQEGGDDAAPPSLSGNGR
jgi:cold shock CspA family protein